MLTKKKKIFMLAGMIVLLAATVWLNAVLASNATSPDPSTPVASSFADFRTRREATRLETVTYLDSVIAATAEDPERRDTALDQKMQLIAAMEMEANVETLLRAQGFEEVGVQIGITTDIVTVLVATAELTDQQVSIIYDVLWDHAQIEADDISIFPM